MRRATLSADGCGPVRGEDGISARDTLVTRDGSTPVDGFQIVPHLAALGAAYALALPIVWKRKRETAAPT
jgi:hypothetical protein